MRLAHSVLAQAKRMISAIKGYILNPQVLGCLVITRDIKGTRQQNLTNV